MKIIVNPDNLICDDTWQKFYKVRAIIENDEGEFLISHEGGKCIFPGGKVEGNESNVEAIKREIKEEAGIELEEDKFIEVLELETLYKDVYDYRTDSLRPRYTRTVYFYAKCSKEIDRNNMNLTSGEKDQGFNIYYVSQENLFKMLSKDHSKAVNGVFFDEENRIVVEEILNKCNVKKV